MKRLYIYFLIIILLTACASAPGSGNGSCDQGVCVKVTSEGSLKNIDSAKMTISLTSDKDQDVVISILSSPPIILEEPKSLDNATLARQGEGNLAWNPIRTKANSLSTFTFNVRFQKEGLYYLLVTATVKGKRIDNGVNIMYRQNVITAYFEGTPIPTYHVGLLPLDGPTPTLYPTPTPWSPFTPVPPTRTTTPNMTSTSPAYPPPSGSPTTVTQIPGKATGTPTLPAYPNPTR